jgi:hypothetical protein
MVGIVVISSAVIKSSVFRDRMVGSQVKEHIARIFSVEE